MTLSTNPPATTPRSSWALIVEALAELGAREIERRERAAQQAADRPRRDEAQAQHDQTQPTEARG